MVDWTRIAAVVFMGAVGFKVVTSLVQGDLSMALWAGFAGFWCWQAEFVQIERKVR